MITINKVALKPQDVTDADIAYGGNMAQLLPKYDEIPEEFKRGRSKWNRVVSDWFFCGLKNCRWAPKDSIDAKKAIRHIKAIMSSWEPKHEHKEAGCAYLLSEFFSDVQYERSKPL